VAVRALSARQWPSGERLIEEGGAGVGEPKAALGMLGWTRRSRLPFVCRSATILPPACPQSATIPGADPSLPASEKHGGRGQQGAMPGVPGGY
jgi:hypothetical protein